MERAEKEDDKLREFDSRHGRWITVRATVMWETRGHGKEGEVSLSDILVIKKLWGWFGYWKSNKVLSAKHDLGIEFDVSKKLLGMCNCAVSKCIFFLFVVFKTLFF